MYVRIGLKSFVSIPVKRHQVGVWFKQHVHAGAVALVICHDNEAPKADVEWLAPVVLKLYLLSVCFEIHPAGGVMAC